MPYKNIAEKRAYDKGYNRGYWKATKDHLGGKCQVCGTTKNLEIHHINPLYKVGRNKADLKDLSVLRLACKKHHKSDIM